MSSDRYRLRELPHAALYAEIHFAAGPLAEDHVRRRAVPRDYATLFVTPGLRVKFEPDDRVSPYVVAGGGYGLFEQSLNQINLRPNTAPRFTHRGEFGYGGGVDVRLWRDVKWLRYVGLRGEARDFYTGNPFVQRWCLRPRPAQRHRRRRLRRAILEDDARASCPVGRRGGKRRR